jgi:TRAP-type C4-dicarboxylate transport system substrate-binding protein
MKRLILALSAATAALALLVPGSSGAQQAPYELNIGSLAPKGTPWMDMLEKIEKQIETASNGKINVIVRPPGVMSEVEMVREVRTGERLQGCGVTTAAVAEGGNLATLQLVELPYLFNSNEEADYILDNVLWQPVQEGLGKRGYVLAAWSENGWRNFGTKGSPVHTPDDLKKFKMRAQESDVHMAMYAAFGAQAVQKPMTEVLTDLQSGVIDGMDSTALYIQAGGLAESLDYYTVSRHIYQPAVVIWSKKWHDALPADLQAVVDDVKADGVASRAQIRSEEAAMMDNFQLYGVEVVELTPAEREAFAVKGRGMHTSFAATIDGGPEFLKKITDGLATYRAAHP